MAHAYMATLPAAATARASSTASISLLPSPPDSPPPMRPRPPADGFSQLSLKGKVRAYVQPDHSWGESFPGKQSPTTQLSLFESGVVKKVSSRRA